MFIRGMKIYGLICYRSQWVHLVVIKYPKGHIEKGEGSETALVDGNSIHVED